MKAIIFFIIFSIFFCAAFAQPSKGKASPEISLPDANGKSISLSSLKGKIVLIDFWASWCGPCRRSNYMLHKVYDKYKSKGFEVYGISVDAEKRNWLEAVREDKINWLQVNDADGSVANNWQIQYIPQSYLLDKNGKVLDINIEPDKLDKLLQKLLQ